MGVSLTYLALPGSCISQICNLELLSGGRRRSNHGALHRPRKQRLRGERVLNAHETHSHNKWLQPSMIVLGTPTNPAPDHCLVYNVPFELDAAHDLSGQQ